MLLELAKAQATQNQNNLYILLALIVGVIGVVCAFGVSHVRSRDRRAVRRVTRTRTSPRRH